MLLTSVGMSACQYLSVLKPLTAPSAAGAREYALNLLGSVDQHAFKHQACACSLQTKLYFLLAQMLITESNKST